MMSARLLTQRAQVKIATVYGVRLDPLGSRSPPYECIKFGYSLQNTRFLLLSSSLAREQLQIDTDLLLIITSTADEFPGVVTSMTLNDLDPKIGVFSEFFFAI